MNTVTVSQRYQIVLPLMVRKELGIVPGQEVQIIVYNNRIELIPLKEMKQMRGFVKGIDTEIPRDADRL